MSKTIGLAIILLSAGTLLCVAGLLINDFRQDQEIEELRGQIEKETVKTFMLKSEIDELKQQDENWAYMIMHLENDVRDLKEPLTQEDE